MAKDNNSKEHIVHAPDVESQLRCTAAPNEQAAAATEEFEDECAWIGMGIALFFLILVGLVNLITLYICTVAIYDPVIVYNKVDHYINYVDKVNTVVLSGCFYGTLVIASILKCGFRCTGNYRFKPQPNKWATATLAMLCLVLIIQIIAHFFLVSSSGRVFFVAIESALLFLALALMEYSIFIAIEPVVMFMVNQLSCLW